MPPQKRYAPGHKASAFSAALRNTFLASAEGTSHVRHSPHDLQQELFVVVAPGLADLPLCGAGIYRAGAAERRPLDPGRVAALVAFVFGTAAHPSRHKSLGYAADRRVSERTLSGSPPSAAGLRRAHPLPCHLRRNAFGICQSALILADESQGAFSGF